MLHDVAVFPGHRKERFRATDILYRFVVSVFAKVGYAALPGRVVRAKFRRREVAPVLQRISPVPTRPRTKLPPVYFSLERPPVNWIPAKVAHCVWSSVHSFHIYTRYYEILEIPSHTSNPSSLLSPIPHPLWRRLDGETCECPRTREDAPPVWRRGKFLWPT